MCTFHVIETLTVLGNFSFHLLILVRTSVVVKKRNDRIIAGTQFFILIIGTSWSGGIKALENFLYFVAQTHKEK